MTKPLPCPHVKKGIGPCIMCPGGPDSVFGNVPQSYTGKEPAAKRAIRNNYDPYLQVMNRLEQYIALNQNASKIELIIMGGTFPSFPKRYREYFITYAFKAMNDFSQLFFHNNCFDFIKFKKFFELPGDVFDEARTQNIHKKLLEIKNKRKTELKKEQLKNEKSNIRCVSLVIETRADYAMLKHANEMLRMGCTKVELGIQTIYDDVLERIRRGHDIKTSIDSTKVLKDLGFKINYHIMLGLPGVNKKQDFNALQTLFDSEKFRPDMLKIYPCIVLKGTGLYELWKNKKYKPLTTKQAVELIARFKKSVPVWVRISRVQRDIPTFITESGADKTNLRQYVNELMKKKKIKCRCIRCRESGHFLRDANKQENLKKLEIEDIQILTTHYQASDSDEFFISAEDTKNDVLFGYCRLRFPSLFLRKEITQNSALIRELHVYSPLVPIGKKSKGSYQHKGIGKRLLETAENIAKTHGKNKMVVISGIGARNYFRRLSYKKEGVYMVKFLN